MPRKLRPEVVRRVQRIALANGGKVRTFTDGTLSRTVEWDVAGRCESPVKVELSSRASANHGEKHVYVQSTLNRPNFVEMDVRCRKCPQCLRQRGIMWGYRAREEWNLAPRTWLATLTLDPGSHAHLLNAARHDLRKQGVDFDALPVDEQFLLIDAQGYAQIQLWLKSLRKNSGVPIRFLAVTEAHKSGVPHWHVLIHEKDLEKPLRHAVLKGSWKLGFDSYKLVADARAASYVTKYLSKEMRARVRASLRYGGGKTNAAMPPNAEETKGT